MKAQTAATIVYYVVFAVNLVIYYLYAVEGTFVCIMSAPPISYPDGLTNCIV